MNLLLDTHTLYWALYGSPNLSAAARRALSEAKEVWVSALSNYELGLKVNLRRLPPFPRPLSEMAEQLGYFELPVSGEHAERAASLPLIHRDPWDRILAAQAITENLTVLTRDPEIAALGASTLW